MIPSASEPWQPPRRLVGISLKMYFSAAQTRTYITDLVSNLRVLPPDILGTIDIFLIPDHITITASIAQLREAASPSLSRPIAIYPGAQDTFWADRGAYTGAVSPAVLAEVGVRIVEVGHAERRRLFGETDADTARRAAAVVRNGMVPLVCVGEENAPTGGQRDSNGVRAAVGAVLRQVEVVIEAVDAVDPSAEVVLAYEPVWAIGAAEPAAVEHVIGVAAGIRATECVRRRRGPTRLIYGGSAGPGLFQQLKGAVDGLFLGRFAHEPRQCCQTIVEVAEA